MAVNCPLCEATLVPHELTKASRQGWMRCPKCDHMTRVTADGTLGFSVRLTETPAEMEEVVHHPCARCGKNTYAKGPHCSRCQVELKKKICPRCGEPVGPGYNKKACRDLGWCRRCWDAEHPVQAEEPKAAPPPPPPPPPPRCRKCGRVRTQGRTCARCTHTPVWVLSWRRRKSLGS
jgi:hypothetical protein